MVLQVFFYFEGVSGNGRKSLTLHLRLNLKCKVMGGFVLQYVAVEHNACVQQVGVF